MLDAVHAQARAERAHVQLDACLDLLGACRRKDLAGVDGHRVGSGRPLGQALDAVGVERHIVPGLEYHPVDRRGDRFVVQRIARAAAVFIPLNTQLLATQACGQQQAIIEKAQRVGERRTAHTALADNAGIVQIACGETVECRALLGDRLVKVVAGGAAEQIRTALFGPDARQPEVDLVTDRAGLQLAVDAGHGRLVVFIMRDKGRCGRGIACGIVDGWRAIYADLASVLRAHCGIQRPVFVEVVLGAAHAEGVFGFGPGPVRRVIGIRVRSMRHAGQGAVDKHRIAALVDALLLIGKIAGQTEVVTSVIKPQREQLAAMLFILDAGLAFALRQVETRAKAIAFAKALPQVEMLADPTVAADVGGETTRRRILRALGLQVHAAANPGAGRGHAVDEGVGTLEHFNAFQRIGRYDLARQYAVETVVGNIVGGQLEAANDEDARGVGIATRLTHRCIIEQYVADGFGLLVLDQLFGVTAHGERHVHDVGITQNTQLPAARHLPASINRR